MRQKNKLILLLLLVFLVSCSGPKTRDTSKRVSKVGVDFSMNLDKEIIADESIYIPVVITNYRDVPMNVDFKLKSLDYDVYDNIKGETSVTIEGKDYELEKELIKRRQERDEESTEEVKDPRNIYSEVFGYYRYYKDKIKGDSRTLNVEGRLSYEDDVEAKLSICLKRPDEKVENLEDCQYQQLGDYRGEQKITYSKNKLGNAQYAAIAVSKVDVTITKKDENTIRVKFRVVFTNQGGGKLSLESGGNIYGFSMDSTFGSLSSLVCTPDTGEIPLKDAINPKKGVLCSGFLTLDQGYVTEHLIIRYGYSYIVTKNAIAEVIR